MKLITEMTEDVKCLIENNDSGQRRHFIEGIFMQAETKNRNGRIYPLKTLVNEINRYNKKYVVENRALGELNHPKGPSVNLDRVSHIVKDLRVEGNNIYGKAKIMDTPMGNIAKNLINEGARLGVSSRGMGSLKKNLEGINEVQNDFMLSAVDIVADPSAPGAFVNGIMEGHEWVWDNGILKEKEIDRYHKEITKASKLVVENKAVEIFKDFLSKL